MRCDCKTLKLSDYFFCFTSIFDNLSPQISTTSAQEPPAVLSIRHFLKEGLIELSTGTLPTFGPVPSKGVGYKATDEPSIRPQAAPVISAPSLQTRMEKAFAKAQVLFEAEEARYVEEDSDEDNDDEGPEEDDENVVEVSKVLAHNITEDGYDSRWPSNTSTRNQSGLQKKASTAKS